MNQQFLEHNINTTPTFMQKLEQNSECLLVAITQRNENVVQY